jgi:hypothetical protein
MGEARQAVDGRGFGERFCHPYTTAAVLGRLNSQEDTRGTRFGDHDPNKYWTENPNSLRSHPSTNHVDANRRASRPNGHP